MLRNRGHNKMKNIMNLMREKGDKLLLAMGVLFGATGCSGIKNNIKLEYDNGDIEYLKMNSSSSYSAYTDREGDGDLDEFFDAKGNLYLIVDSLNQKIDTLAYLPKGTPILRDSEKGQEFEKEYKQIKLAYEAQGAQ